MQLTIDIGNSSLKAALFPDSSAKPLEARIHDAAEPVSTLRIALDDYGQFRGYVGETDISACIISSTSILPDWLFSYLNEKRVGLIHVMDGITPLPVVNLYETPSTLGTDRISSVIGAYYSAGCQHAVMCIDSGTAITYDIINAKGEYIGGNISPGMEMRFKALHDYTSRLPYVLNRITHSEIGTSTESAIANGVKVGMRKEIEGYIRTYSRKYPGLCVFFTGGDQIDFDYRTKKRIFADRNLVLKGLNIILNNLQYQK